MAEKKQTSESSSTKDLPKQVRFIYHKSPLYRVIKVTGAIGGVVPTGEVNVTLYGDRLPIPDWTEQQVLENGSLGSEAKHAETAGHISREVEATLSLTPQTARSIGLWLIQHADAVMKLQEEMVQQIANQEAEGH